MSAQEKLYQLASTHTKLRIEKSWSWTKRPYWTIVLNDTVVCASGYETLDACINELWSFLESGNALGK